KGKERHPPFARHVLKLSQAVVWHHVVVRSPRRVQRSGMRICASEEGENGSLRCCSLRGVRVLFFSLLQHFCCYFPVVDVVVDDGGVGGYGGRRVVDVVVVVATALDGPCPKGDCKPPGPPGGRVRRMHRKST
ncbi:unnamed protein product, partial [Ectocarpus sp. 4 AP-2014]